MRPWVPCVVEMGIIADSAGLAALTVARHLMRRVARAVDIVVRATNVCSPAAC